MSSKTIICGTGCSTVSERGTSQPEWVDGRSQAHEAWRNASQRVIIALAAFILLSFAAGGQAADSLAPLALPGYIAELSYWKWAAGRLVSHPDEAGDFKQRLPTVWVVEFQGQQFVTPTDWLRRALETVESSHQLTPSASSEIQSRLESLEMDARALLAAPEISPASAQSVLSGILQRREFQHVHGPTVLQRAWERISDWVSGLLKHLFGKMGIRIHLGPLFLWLLVVAIGLTLAVWLFRLSLQTNTQLAIDLSGPLNLPKNWRDWLREAAARAEGGDYREAVHCAYWVAVYFLADRGAWRADWTRTPREYVRLLKEGDAQREPLATITRYFERIWYGARPASAEDFQAVAAELEKFGCISSPKSSPATGRS